MSRSTLVTRNVLATFGTQVLAATLTFAVTFYLPRYVGDAGLGKLAFAASLVSLLWVFVQFGTNIVLVKEIARDRSCTGTLLAASLLLRFPLSLAMGALALGIVTVLGYPDITRLLVAVTAGAMTIATLNEAVGFTLQGLEQMPRQSIAVLVEKCLSAGITIALILRREPLWTIAGVGIFSGSVSLLVNLSTLREVVPRLSWPAFADLRSLVIAGAPLLGWLLSKTTYEQTDPMVLSVLTNDATVGWYAAAVRFVGATVLLASAITFGMAPTLSRLYKEDATEFQMLSRRMWALVMLVGMPAALVLILAPNQLIGFMRYPIGFQHCLPVLRLGGIAVLLYLSASAFGTAVISCDRQKQMLRASIVATTLGIPLCCTATYICHHLLHNGAIGAMASDLVLETYLIRSYASLLPTGTFGSETAVLLTRYFICGIPMAFVLLLGSYYHCGLWVVLPGGLGYLVMCCLLRCITGADLADIRSIFIRKAIV